MPERELRSRGESGGPHAPALLEPPVGTAEAIEAKWRRVLPADLVQMLTDAIERGPLTWEYMDQDGNTLCAIRPEGGWTSYVAHLRSAPRALFDRAPRAREARPRPRAAVRTIARALRCDSRPRAHPCAPRCRSSPLTCACTRRARAVRRRAGSPSRTSTS